MSNKRNRLLPHNRVKAIAEELAGFLLTHVIDELGEFYFDDRPPPPPAVDATREPPAVDATREPAPL